MIPVSRSNRLSENLPNGVLIDLNPTRARVRSFRFTSRLLDKPEAFSLQTLSSRRIRRCNDYQETASRTHALFFDSMVSTCTKYLLIHDLTARAELQSAHPGLTRLG